MFLKLYNNQITKVLPNNYISVFFLNVLNVLHSIQCYNINPGAVVSQNCNDKIMH